ncbi:N-acetyltransferase family protein [Sphingomonas sp. AR_OL41]|uniref:GNAT family N-acetyltransferase n=1 Tax=Sphingomonas sp. AR_OL41 TaxID=3042729 RepID=UPI00247FEA8D|nr:GNAT family N-acetyltransferase [Sphingomonas sp. AR_OL41]MDH7972688.1 N-acetyltransferase family protein [Sphingomonas sp. AR_OL41]
MVIAVRPATPDDAAAIAAIYKPYVEGATVSFELKAPDERIMRTRMTASDGYYPWLVVTEGEGGEVLGYAYATKFRDRPAYQYTIETGVYLKQGTQGRGNGRQLYDALIDTVRAQGFTHAISVIALPNDHMIRLHESVGFQRTGVLREAGYKAGRWIDVGFWQCRLNDSTIPPREPKPFSEVGMVWNW